MPHPPDQSLVLERLVAWGESEPTIRALVLTSNRARDDGSADLLSDYDVIVAVREADAFATDVTWASKLGRPLVRWGDDHKLLGRTTWFRGVVYADGARIDYSIWPEELLDTVAQAEVLPDDVDVGYRVLLDKDGATASWKPASYRAHIPAPPTKAEYEELVDEFWWDTTAIAKSLWRGEVFFTKFLLDYDAKFVALRTFLEWRIELDHDWSLRPGSYGRGLERLLPADISSELAATYVGTDVDANWEALFRTTALFRRVATEVGDALGYAYPLEKDEAVTAQLETVRGMPPRQGFPP